MKEIESGRIGEVICLLRLAKMGIQSEIVNLGTSDILSFAYDHTWRIQVKASHIKKNRKGSFSTSYQFSVCKGGAQKEPLTEDDCDIVALVGIPQERVMFSPVSSFSGVKTKRMTRKDFDVADIEWSSWVKSMKYYGITPPRPSCLPVPDQLLKAHEDPHKSP